MTDTAETEVPPLTADPPELETLEIEVDGQVGTLTLNRPDALNAMSPELIGELTTAAAWLADRAPIRALIVTGAGRAFCSGGDVNWFKRGVTDESVDLPSEVRRGAEALHNAIVDIRRIPYPVIAAINGPAAGAGHVAGALRGHPDRLRGGLPRDRLRAHRGGPGRRHDLLPAARGRPGQGARAGAQRPQPRRERRARGRAGDRGRPGRRAARLAPGRRPRSSPPRLPTTCA